MELLRHDFKVTSRKQTFRIYFMADFHVGAAGCDHKLLEKHIRHILKDPDGYAVFGGDLNEAIKKKDRRYDAAAVHPKFRDKNPRNIIGNQYNYIEHLVEPLYTAGKILVFGEGNHERTYANENDLDIIDQLCQRYPNVPYGGYSFVLVLMFHREPRNVASVLVHFHHGKKGGTTKAGKMTALEKQSHRVEGCDIYMRGHGHQKVMTPDQAVSIGLDRQGEPLEKSRKVWQGSTGAYLRILEEGHSSYAEIAEYEPTDLGCIYAEIQPFHLVAKNRTAPMIELRDLVI